MYREEVYAMVTHFEVDPSLLLRQAQTSVWASSGGDTPRFTARDMPSGRSGAYLQRHIPGLKPKTWLRGCADAEAWAYLRDNGTSVA